MRTYLSNVAAKMYFPFGENLTKETGGLSSSEFMKIGIFLLSTFFIFNCKIVYQTIQEQKYL